jgi:CRP/FNR family cyclic AMP-dependent transcriptional regulator
MSENIWSLKRCDLFERLTPAERHRLETRAVMRAFKRKEIIYFPSEPGLSVLVVLRGKVKIKTITPDGKETIFAFFGEGELFGELALLETEPRNEYAEAVEEAEILAIPRDEMLAIMEQRPDIAMHVTKLVGLRRRRIENRLRNILFHSNRERVVALLLELIETHGEQEADGWQIRLELSHQDLANLIGATRETVTLTLLRMKQEKLIKSHRRRIKVIDRDRLAQELNVMAPNPESPTPAPPGAAPVHVPRI